MLDRQVFGSYIYRKIKEVRNRQFYKNGTRVKGRKSLKRGDSRKEENRGRQGGWEERRKKLVNGEIKRRKNYV